MNRVGGQRQHSFSPNAEKSYFCLSPLCLERIEKLCSYFIIIVAFASASSWQILLVSSVIQPKLLLFLLLCFGLLKTLWATAQKYT